MWRLIKAEIFYFRGAVLFTTVFLILFSGILIIDGADSGKEVSYRLLGFIVYMFMIGKWGHYIFYKENLERFYAQLPMGLKTISLARIFSGLFLWLIYLTIYLLWYLLFPGRWDAHFSFYSIYTINGIVLMVNVSPLLWHDYLFISHAKRKKLISYIGYFPIVLGMVVLTQLLTSQELPFVYNYQVKSQGFLFSASGAAILNLSGILLSILSYRMYLKRYSYLKSEFGLKMNIRVKDEDIS